MMFFRYTNADNPFGDGKLLETFVWHKKLEEDGLNHLAPNQKKSLMKSKQEANKIELAKVSQYLDSSTDFIFKWWSLQC